MYAQFKSFIFQMIPGYCVSDFVYLGMIIFIFSGFLANKKWTPFFITAIFGFTFKLLDLLVLNQNINVLVEQFFHITTLPFILTLLYSRKS